MINREIVQSAGVVEYSVGFFNVIHRAASYLPREIRDRLFLEPHHPIFQLHMHNALEVQNDREILLQFRQGFPEVAKHAQSNNFRPESVFGLTYERLAKGAVLFGFKRFAIDETQLPPGEIEIINEGYSKTRDYAEGRPMGPINLCYQTFERFIARFGQATA